MFCIELAVPFVVFVPPRFRRVRVARLRTALPAAGAHRGHRQLRLLQPVDRHAVHFPAGRRGNRPRAALAAGAGRIRAAGVAAAGPPKHGHGAAGRDPGGPERADVRARDPATGADAGLVPMRCSAPWPPLRSVNGYGLFRVMTTERPEIVVEGSVDGATWTEYAFPWKAGDLSRAPRLRPAAHAAPRLADVVRGARPAAAVPLAVRPGRSPAGQQSGRAGPSPRQSVPPTSRPPSSVSCCTATSSRRRKKGRTGTGGNASGSGNLTEPIPRRP